MHDYIYYYTNDTFKKILLGEIQSDFNMSFVIDGTKDSAKVEVQSFVGDEMKPYTIIKHQLTNTWWIVSHDKVTRDSNENGFYYTHQLQLLGAIELLNARDLTDCGFDQNNYTIWGYISRLISLSNFEFNGYSEWDGYEVQSPNLDINQNVDYIKTFENYTLLSALREFLDGYNCDIKLEFNEEQDSEHYGDNEYHIYSASFIIVSKTGNNETPHQESEFKDIRETKTIDKNSYGTTVVSNAENVISTKAKTYPSVGGAKLRSDSNTVTINNAYLQLPSNIAKLNWLKIFAKVNFVVKVGVDDYRRYFYIGSGMNPDKLVDYIIDSCFYEYDNYVKNQVRTQLNSQKEYLFDFLTKAFTITLRPEWVFNPVTNGVVANTNDPTFYLPNWKKKGINGQPTDAPFNLVIGEEQVVTTINEQVRTVRYKRGENKITNFVWLCPFGSTTETSWITGFESTDLQDGSWNERSIIFDFTFEYEPNGSTEHVYIKLGHTDTGIEHVPNLVLGETTFQVNYIPASDMKIKYDNTKNGRDIQVYNQNGKMTDSVALSKLLLSYSKEIQGDTITKYSSYYKFSDIPLVGKTVMINNEKYVINNVSCDFYLNELNSTLPSSSPYFIDCEFTMSKQVSNKSLMTNPNSNIRDYGIPQNNNVYRRQLYRDFYEFDYTIDSDSDTNWYLTIDKVLNVSNSYKSYQEHMAIMKLTYDEQVGNSETWYYQLNTTTYVMKKSIYEIIDFQDNNIIGYDFQNSISGFDVTRILNNPSMAVSINTPISYTDNKGKVKGFEIAMCNSTQVKEIYDGYDAYVLQEEGSSLPSNYPIYNASVFIDPPVYEGSGISVGAKDNCDFIISEPDYYKDAIEVPMFEYSCQLDDTNNVIVGDNILDSEMEDECYMYGFAIVPKNVCDNNNYINYAPPLFMGDLDYENTIILYNTANISFVNGNVKIDLMDTSTYVQSVKLYTPPEYASGYNIDTTKELAIFRYTINKKWLSTYQYDGTTYVKTKCDLMFVCKNLDLAPSGVVSNKSITLTTNHYKIK